MNLIILEEKEKSGNYYQLANYKAEHIIKILKSEKGDTLNAGLLGASTGQAKIESIDYGKNEVTLSYFPQFNAQRPDTRLVLYTAMQRPQTAKKILHLCACSGFTAVNFFVTDKSQKSYFTSSLWIDEGYRQFLMEGLEQCKRIILPEVKIYKYFPEIQDDSLKLALDEKGEKLFKMENELRETKNITIAMGPESGFTENDLLRLEAGGFIRTSLADFPLRSENSLSWLLGQINYIKQKLV